MITEGIQIAYLQPETEIQGYYLLKSAAVRSSSNGRPYLSAVLSDATGSADGKMWDYSGGLELTEGKIIKLRARVTEFNGKIQLNISRIRQADDRDNGEYSINDIIPSAPIDSIKEMEYVQDLITGIEDPDYRNIAATMFDRHMASFGKIPAGKTIHHAFLSGLLMHTANMLKIADFLASEVYPDVVDRSLLLAGTLLHDFAKEREYVMSEYGLMTDVTREGALLGHLVMGAEEVGEVGRSLGAAEEKIVLLKHMILSHHGEPEFGAAVKPCIAESELLSEIDMMDSRMEIYAENFEHIERDEFSDRIPALDKRIYNHR